MDAIKALPIIIEIKKLVIAAIPAIASDPNVEIYIIAAVGVLLLSSLSKLFYF